MADESSYIVRDDGLHDELPKYLCLGHGLEEIADKEKESFEDRSVLPKGYCVVTFVEAGDVAYNKEVCPMFNLFTNEDKEINDILSNPELHKDKMPPGMRVYYPGMKLPNLVFNPNTSWEDSRLICKAGVFKYPIHKDIIFPMLEATDIDDEVYINYMKECNNGFCKLIDESQVSKDNIHTNKFPETWKGTEMEERLFSSGVEVTLEIIMRKLKKGIYYFPICRACKEYVTFVDDEVKTRPRIMPPDERLMLIREKSNIQHMSDLPMEIPEDWPPTKLELFRLRKKQR